MRSASIATLLDHIGSPPDETLSLREAVSALRPRVLSSGQGEPRLRPAFSSRQESAAAAVSQQSFPRPIPARKPSPWSAHEPPSAAANEANSAEAVARRLAKAIGREEGLAEGRAQAEEQFSRELAALREQAEQERRQFQESECARLEAAIRAGLSRLSEDIGAAVARILARFLSDRLATRAVEELRASIDRVCAGGSSGGAIAVRGPENLLRLLKERVADLPADISYVPDGGVEVVVEVGPTRIATELRAWSELLASLEDQA